MNANLGIGLMLVLASVVIHNPWLKLIGAIYLIKLAFENLGMAEAKESEQFQSERKAARFWMVVLNVELAELAFSLNNVVAAVSLSDQLWEVMLGVAIGILTMRFAAGLFSKAVIKEPIMNKRSFRWKNFIKGNKNRLTFCLNHLTIRIIFHNCSAPGKLEPAFASFTDLQDPPQKQHGKKFKLIIPRVMSLNPIFGGKKKYMQLHHGINNWPVTSPNPSNGAMIIIEEADPLCESTHRPVQGSESRKLSLIVDPAIKKLQFTPKILNRFPPSTFSTVAASQSFNKARYIAN